MRKYKAILSKEYSFNTLLILVVVYIFFVLPLKVNTDVEDFLFFGFYLLLLSSAMPFLIRNKRFGLLAGFMIVPIVFLLMEFLYPAQWVRQCIDIFIIFYIAVLVWTLVVRTFSRGSMDRNRVLGAILIYLLIAFEFAMIYHLIYLIYGQEAIQGLLVYNRREFVYFSISSLTTIGYGGVTPKLEFARSMANMEALTGQLYPAVLIARIVSMEGVGPVGRS